MRCSPCTIPSGKLRSMSHKPSFVALAVAAALLVLGAGLTAGWFALQGNRPLLQNAVLDSEQITPNAGRRQ